MLFKTFLLCSLVALSGPLLGSSAAQAGNLEWWTGTTRNLHVPIPSLSSQAFRDFLVEPYRQVGAHFKGSSVLGYFLWQEPSYALLRENVCFSNGWSDNASTQVGDSRRFEADYSQAELGRHNSWRAARG